MATILSDRRAIGLWLAVLALTLAHGLLWWALTPPWAAPDEPGHYLYARLLADRGRLPTAADLTPAVEDPVLASLFAHDWWAYNGYPPPPAPPARWQDDPTLAASGSQIENEPPLFYLIPALWLRHAPAALTADPAVALRWLRLWPLLLRLAATAAALALAQQLWPRQPGRWASVGLLVGLLPMVGFIGGSFNNAALALSWGAVAFWSLVRHPRLAWLLILLGPLLADLSLVFLWPLAAAAWLWRLRPRLAAAAAVGLILALLLLFLPRPEWAAGWRRSHSPMISRGPQGLTLSPSPSRSLFISQIIAGKELAALQGQTLRLQAEILTQPPPPLFLEWQQDAEVATHLCMDSICQFTIVIPAGAAFLRIAAANAAGQAVAFRLALVDAGGRQWLDNGDGRRPAPRGSALFRALERRLPLPAGFFERLAAPATWDAAAQFRYLLFSGFTWASFWGYFGWLSRPLPWWGYLLLAAANVAAGFGLLQALPTAARRWRRQALTPGDRALALAALALLLILAQVWTPMLGQAWQPQGRYLFPALLPIALLLVAGWEGALAGRAWPFARRDPLPLLLVILLTAFNLLAWRIAR